MYLKQKVDMTAFGQAVKEARESKGWSREKLAEMLDLAPRYIMYIEMRGQHMSLLRSSIEKPAKIPSAVN